LGKHNDLNDDGKELSAIAGKLFHITRPHSKTGVQKPSDAAASKDMHEALDNF